jgi:hypothetical protein
MSKVFYCTEFHLSTCNVCELSPLKNVNFKFKLSIILLVLYFRKSDLNKSLSFSETYQHVKCHVPMLTGASSASTSEVCMSAILQRD